MAHFNRSALPAALLAALVAFASATATACPTKCGFSFTQGPTCGPRSITYTFDLSPLCGTQHTTTDSVGHTYATSICANSAQKCLPATWTNTYQYGVTIQMWGETPKCTSPPACTDPSTGAATCCTADCQVLGVLPAEHWEVVDPANPATGGIMVTYTGAPGSDSDPFWCSFDPATGAQYPRRVRHIYQCAPKIDTVQVIGASQNSTNDCDYTITFASQHACAQLSAMRAVPVDSDGNVLTTATNTIAPPASGDLGARRSASPPQGQLSLHITPGSLAGIVVACAAVGLAAGYVAFKVLSGRHRQQQHASAQRFGRGSGARGGVELLAA